MHVGRHVDGGPASGVEEILRGDVEARIVGADVAVHSADHAAKTVAGAHHRLLTGGVQGVVLHRDQGRCAGHRYRRPIRCALVVLLSQNHPSPHAGRDSPNVLINRAYRSLAAVVTLVDPHQGALNDIRGARCGGVDVFPIARNREVLIPQVQRSIGGPVKVIRIGRTAGAVSRRQLDHRGVADHCRQAHTRLGGDPVFGRGLRHDDRALRGQRDRGADPADNPVDRQVAMDLADTHRSRGRAAAKRHRADPAADVQEILRGDVEARVVGADVAVHRADRPAKTVAGTHYHLLARSMRRVVLHRDQGRGAGHRYQRPIQCALVVLSTQIYRDSPSKYGAALVLINRAHRSVAAVVPLIDPHQCAVSDTHRARRRAEDGFPVVCVRVVLIPQVQRRVGALVQVISIRSTA